MKLSRFELKILKCISRHPSGISHQKITRKCKRHNISHILERLMQGGYINCNCIPDFLDNGTCILPSVSDILYTLTDEGIIEIESHRFLTFANIFQHLIAPIIVGVLSALITALILA